MRIVFVFIILLILSLQGFAQFKYEKEYRIKKSDVPTNALSFVDSLNFNSRVRWFKEIGLNSISFEAKTKYKGKRYSIEFSEDGTFEDIEIEIKSSEITAEIFNNISKYLSEEHHKYSIQKIQVQYSGDTRKILDYFRNKKPSADLTINNEIVISSKVDGSFKMFEYLFSENGEFIKRAQIILYKTDNIEY